MRLNIRNGVLKKCTLLPGEAEVILPKRVKIIGEGVFKGCTALTSVVIPDNVEEISSKAFDNTKWLNGQPDGMIYINKIAYRYKGDCPSTVEFKADTVKINDFAFEECSRLTSIVIPGNVEKIGCHAFADCTHLTNIVIPDSVEEIDWQAFQGCTDLQKIVIPNTVKEIGFRAFYGCTHLTEMVIPDSVKEIGWCAFEGCTRLTRIVIPDSVQEIGEDTFVGCNLKKLVICASGGSYAEQYAKDNGIRFEPIKKQRKAQEKIK